MSYRGKLFGYRKIYDHENTNAVFLEAVRECAQFHMENCPEYARILRHACFEPGQLQRIEDLYKLPPIPTLFLKAHELLSIPEKRLHLVSTTSGTGGKPVRVGLDAMSLYHGFWMLARSLSYHKLFSIRPVNYIMLGYQPSKHNHMGAVRTAYGSTFLAPALHREYALKDTGTDYALNIEAVKHALLRYGKKRAPVRLVGFPAYLHFMLQMMREEDIRLSLHPKSLVFLGGGWKQFFTEQVDKPALYSMVEERLGIGARNCKEFFGVVENQVSYIACERHHFHVPIYGRVLIRDPRTLLPVENGTPGLLNLITPFLYSMPLLSIITDDIAVLYDGAQCGCGIPAPYFEVLGRVGMQEIKTCAAGAGELLKESKP